MFTILAINGWNVLDQFIEALIPISIVVVLPVLVILIVMRQRRYEVDKKTEILLKAVENGTQLDPAFFEISSPRKRTVKDKLMGRLTTALVTGTIGLITLVAQIVLFSVKNLWQSGGDEVFVFPILSGIILAVGIAFLIVYLVGKRIYAKELAELGK